MCGVREHWKREESAGRGKAREGTCFLRRGGTWSTEEPEGSPDAQSVVQVEARGKGAEVHRGQITGCLVDPSEEY